MVDQPVTVPCRVGDGRSSRVQWLDGLRGLAATAVMLHHFLVGNSYISTLYRVASRYVDLGVAGVALFFLISGFIVPHSAMLPARKPILKFLVARFFRLYPAYWLAVIAACLMTWPHAPVFLANLTMFQRFFGYPDLIGVFWTLQVELLFYVCIVTSMWAGQISSPKISFAWAAIFSVLSLLMSAIRFYLDRKAPLAPCIGLTLIYSGQVIYWYLQRAAISTRVLGIYLAVVALVICIACRMGYSRDWGFRETPERFIASYGLAVLGFWIAAKSKWSPKFWILVGSFSYSLYLVHSLVGELFIGPESSEIGTGVAVVTCCAISPMLAYVMFRAVEIPGQSLGRIIIGRYQIG